MEACRILCSEVGLERRLRGLQCIKIGGPQRGAQGTGAQHLPSSAPHVQGGGRLLSAFTGLTAYGEPDIVREL